MPFCTAGRANILPYYAENGVEIIRGVLSSDHVHIFVSVPPKLAISDLCAK
jgi:putative transposase